MNREILLAVAGMSGIEDVTAVMPAWMGSPKGKDGMSKAGARAIMLALELRVMGAMALGGIGMSLAEVEKLAQ